MHDVYRKISGNPVEIIAFRMAILGEQGIVITIANHPFPFGWRFGRNVRIE